jgi:hypothetical protein
VGDGRREHDRQSLGLVVGGHHDGQVHCAGARERC